MLFGVGLVGLIAGGTGELLDVTSSDNPATPANEHFDAGGWAPPLLVAGTVLVAAGIVAAIANPHKPDPAKTLCNGELAVAQAATPAPVGVMSSEHTFEQTHQGDPLSEAKKQIIAQMTKEFVDELKAAKASQPHVTTPPPVAPPPAPAPAQP